MSLDRRGYATGMDKMFPIKKHDVGLGRRRYT